MGLDTTQRGTVTGLGTTVFSCKDTNTYTITGTLQLPRAQSLGTNVASAVVTTVLHNVTTIYTSNPGDLGFMTSAIATAGDTISVTLSSSLAQDEVQNAIQCTINISEGESL